MPFDPLKLEQAKKEYSGGFDPNKLAAIKAGADPSLWDRFKAGFMGNEIKQPKGFEKGDIAELAGSGGLETAGGMIGGAIGTAAGAVAAVPTFGASIPTGTALGAGYGAAAGKALHEGIRRGIGAFNPGSTDMGSDLGVVGRVAGEGLAQVAGAKYLPIATKGILTGVGETGKFIGKNVLAPIARSTSGIGKEAMDLLIESPSKVLQYIGKSPETIAGYGKAFQQAIVENTKRAGELYDSIIKNQVKNSPLYTEDFTSNLNRVMADTMGNVRKEFGYGLPNRVVNPKDAELFNSMADNIAQKMRHPTAEELYYLQRDLTNRITENEGKPISAALGQIKEKLMNYMGEKIPEIGEANRIYSSAKTLEEELRGVVNAENPTEMIKNSLAKFTTKGDKILGALPTLESKISEKVATPAVRDIMAKADSIAGARKALEDIVYGTAGKQITPWMKDIPRTGLMGWLGHAAVTNPATILGIGALSPRAVAYGTAGAIKGSENIGRILSSKPVAAIGKYAIPGTISSTEMLMRKYNQK